MSRLAIFRNNDYSALILEDDQKRLVHRTLCIPAWFQFPFMKADDIQFGDVFTTLSARRQGIGQLALRLCESRLAKHGRNFYYVAQPKNLPSHKLALRSGFIFMAIARKKPTKVFGYYSLLPGTADYAKILEIARATHSDMQLRCSVERASHSMSASHSGQFSPTRVLAVVPYSSSSSSMIFATRQVSALASRGHEVETFKLNNRRSFRALVTSLMDYRRRLQEFQPAVVHAHYGAMTGFFSVFGALGLAPVVVTFRGSDLNPVPSSPKWKVWPSHLLSNLSAIGAKHVICVSEELRSRLWWGTSKASLIPTGVDTTKFFPGQRSVERVALGWDDDTPVVLFNAGHTPEVKRLDFAEQVIRLARISLPKLRFVILTGQVAPDEVPNLMRASDCLLFTSDFEGSPTVIQEAMASNLPIVSVAVGDVPERLLQVNQSYILERDPVLLAEALVEVLHYRKRSNGNDIVTEELGNEPISRALEQVYDFVIRR